MEHSVEAYLARQSTAVLAVLLQKYSQEDEVLGIAEIVRQLLRERGYDFSEQEHME